MNKFILPLFIVLISVPVNADIVGGTITGFSGISTPQPSLQQQLDNLEVQIREKDLQIKQLQIQIALLRSHINYVQNTHYHTEYPQVVPVGVLYNNYPSQYIYSFVRTSSHRKR